MQRSRSPGTVPGTPQPIASVQLGVQCRVGEGMAILMLSGCLWGYPWGSKDSLPLPHDTFGKRNTKDTWRESYKLDFC